MTVEAEPAPYGRKLDGTPRKRQGRPPKSGDPTPPRSTPAPAGDLLTRIAHETDAELTAADDEITRCEEQLADAIERRNRLLTAREAMNA